MKMKSRIAVIVLLLSVTAYNRYPIRDASDQKPMMDYEVSGRRGITLNEEKKWSPAPEPWTASQLMAPAELAALINDPTAKKPVIICVGPGATIRGSLDMGPASEKENLEKLKQQLTNLPRHTTVVIYCGCCPFEHCPNIRPAFNLLNEMKFSNGLLLNIEHNLKTDWIAKGYPQ